MSLHETLILVKGIIFIIAMPIIFYLMLCQYCGVHARGKQDAYERYMYSQLEKKDFCEADRAISAEYMAVEDMGFDLPRMLRNWNRDYLSEVKKCP